ncbi:MAG: mechanosensitive ion channel [Cytophagales bacterium]|nr:mechanosensitive ion channel [Cytophagales bacterium]
MKTEIETHTETINELITKAISLSMEYAPRVVLAIITLIVGLWLIKRIASLSEQAMQKAKMDVSLIPFISGLISIGLKIIIVISVASMVGIQTTSFVAVLGATSLAVGLALQGSLSNFAGGVLILILKPYKVNDLVNIDGLEGHVQEIQIFHTIFLTLDKKTIIMPNGKISNDTIINLSAKGYRRVDLEVGISYDDNVVYAQKIIQDVLSKHPLILKDPSPDVEVLRLGESSVDFAVRPYCQVNDYWTVYFDSYKEIKIALDANGITIPFPQRDIHMIEPKK